MTSASTLSGALPAPAPAPAPASTPVPWSVVAFAAGAVLLAMAAGALALVPDGTLLNGTVVVDATSRLFLVLIDVVGAGIALYIWGRLHAEPRLAEYIAGWVGAAALFLVFSNLAVLSNHLLLGWAFLEATTLAAVPLIRFRGTKASLDAAWRYLVFSGLGLALVFLGFACLARSLETAGAAVSFELESLARARATGDGWWRLGIALTVLGYGTKLGLVPMFAWLPDTYDSAPPATTSLLAAVQSNVALLGLVRVVQIARVHDSDLVSFELIALGVATMVVASFGIIVSTRYKRLLGYASMNHAGVIAIGLGLGGEAAYGVVVYVVSNAVIKAILFLSAGKIQAHYRSEEIKDVSGLVKQLPYSGLFFMVGTFALLGLPPFGSFVGELIIMSGLVGRELFVVFVAFAAALTVSFVATGRSMFPMIWGTSRPGLDRPRIPFLAVLPKFIFVALLLAIGLYVPTSINELFRQVAASVGGR